MSLQNTVILNYLADEFGWNPELDKPAHEWLIDELVERRRSYERKPNIATAYHVNQIARGLIDFIEAQKVLA